MGHERYTDTHLFTGFKNLAQILENHAVAESGKAAVLFSIHVLTIEEKKICQG